MFILLIGLLFKKAWGKKSYNGRTGTYIASQEIGNMVLLGFVYKSKKLHHICENLAQIGQLVQEI